MSKKMLIDAAHQEEVRVCVLDNGVVEDFDFESSSRKPLRGNIYLARVTRVEPSLQAAFVEYGGNRHGFLAFNEIHPDYYQVPVSDRRLLQEAEAEEAMLAAELESEDHGDDEADAADEAAEADADTEDGGEDAGDNIPPSNPDPSVYDDSDERFDGRDAADKDDDDRDNDSVAAASEHGHSDDSGADENLEAGDFADEDAEREAGAGDNHVELFEDGPSSSDDAAADAEEDANAAEGEASASLGDEARAGGADSRRRRGELLERYRDAKRRRARLLRNYKIQEVIKRRQILLVQVVKEERGNKGAALTTYMSLAGRYCVLMPNTARGGGISRKIPVAADRKRLRRVVDSLDVPSGMGLIVRTAGAKRTKAEIKRDYEYLIRLWENIRNLTLQSIAPCLIYEEASLIKRAIRDLYDKDIDQVLVEGDAGYREAKDFMKMLVPSHAKSVQPYKEKTPLFLAFDVESQLDAMYQPVVRLKSGGYIVIHQTEALVAIDVNSGKATRERNIELTALKTNLEAAKEAARQCRLRDLAGLIVIDFIDMEEHKNNRTVEKRFKDALRFDRARLQVGRISNFGLLEMSRQRRRSGIVDGTTHACPTCAGAGVVRSSETAALRILRAIEREALGGRTAVIAARASIEVTLYILNNKRDWLKRIEDDYALRIEIIADAAKASDVYEIEKRGAARDLPPATPFIRADQTETIEAAPIEAESPEIEDDVEDADDEIAADGDAGAAREDGDGGRRRRRRGRRGRRGENGQTGDHRRDEPRRATEGEASDDGETSGDEDPPRGDARPNADAADGDGQRKRRRRGRRGGRRNRGRSENGAPETAVAGEHSSLDQPAFEAMDDQPGYDEPVGSPGRSPEIADDRDDMRDEPPQTASPRERAPTSESSERDMNGGGSPLEAKPVQEEIRPDESRPRAAQPDSPPKTEKPAKKGWWQRAIGG